MLSVNLTYNEVQNILYSLREQINNSCNLKHIEEFKKASDKVKKAMHRKDNFDWEKEEENKVEEFRLADMVERVMVG